MVTYPKEVLNYFGKNKIYYSTFLHQTNQKKIASKYISKKLSSTSLSASRILCIGGGSGEADLNIIHNLHNKNLVIDYIDPFPKMKTEFIARAKSIGLAKNLGNLKTGKFEYANYFPPKSDVILGINSFYFIDGWKKKKKDNPLLKLYDALVPGGVAVIVLRSSDSGHVKIKQLVGGGKTTGLLMRKSLKKLGIPFYFETVRSQIDVSCCFKGKSFFESKPCNFLLSFLLGGRWARLSPAKKKEVVTALEKTSKMADGKRLLESTHEYIWITKPKASEAIPQAKMPKSAKKLASKIKKRIKIIPNFPVKGIKFVDMTPVLRDKRLFKEIIHYAKVRYTGKVDYVIAKDMQGLIWAGAIANALGCGMIPMFRKDLAGPVISTEYEHEYNPKRIINLQKEAIKEGDRILLVDYILATGATMKNMANLIEHLGGKITEIFSIVELTYLHPRKGLENYPLHTLVEY